jgi:hypothetical protein
MFSRSAPVAARIQVRTNMARTLILIAMVASFALASATLGITRETRQQASEPLPPLWAHNLDLADLLS